MRKILFIINPVAGKGNSEKVINEIKNRLENNIYTIKISVHSNGITQLVNTTLKSSKYTDVVAVGGDGTLMETINGLPENFKGSIGVIPIGSGNDFAKTLGIPESITESLDLIMKSNVKEGYIGKVNDQYFINVVGVGIDAEVIRLKENSQFLKGQMNYLASTIKGIFKYKAVDQAIHIDEKVIKRKTLFIAIGNGQFIGNGMRITPKASIYKNTLEICLIPKLSKIKLLKSITKLYKGLHGEVKGVEFYEGKNIYMKFSEATAVDVDGNLIMAKELNISKSDRQYRFITKE